MKVIDIIKARWSEVLMLMVFQACCLMVAEDMQLTEYQESMPSESLSGRFLLLGIGISALGIVSQMLLWGFLRTTAVTGAQAIPPGQLLSVGRWYFWKLFLFQLALFVLLIFLAGSLQAVGSLILFGKVIPERIPVWLQVAGMLAAGLILFKPTYFIPALVMVQDCSVWESLTRLRLIKIIDLKRFLILLICFFAILVGLEYLGGLVHRGTLLYYPFMAAQSLISGGGLVVLFLAAVVEVWNRIPRPKQPEEQAEGQTDET
jgi:hypothetical protein